MLQKMILHQAWVASPPSRHTSSCPRPRPLCLLAMLAGRVQTQIPNGRGHPAAGQASTAADRPRDESDLILTPSLTPAHAVCADTPARLRLKWAQPASRLLSPRRALVHETTRIVVNVHTNVPSSASSQGDPRCGTGSATSSACAGCGTPPCCLRAITARVHSAHRW